MRSKRMRSAIVVTAFAAISCAVFAQGNNTPAKTPPASPKFDLSGSFYKTFSTATKGNGTQQTPVDSYGGLFGGRYVQAPFLGLEITYSFNTLDQKLATDPSTCNYTCANPPVTIPNKMSEVAVDYVASKTTGKLRPFAIGGIAFVISSSSGLEVNALNTIVRLGYVYGGGVDYGSSKFGLRAQYRDTFFKAPPLTATYFPTGKFTHTAEPMIGIYFRP